jgi:hypothetical protein
MKIAGFKWLKRPSLSLSLSLLRSTAVLPIASGVLLPMTGEQLSSDFPVVLPFFLSPPLACTKAKNCMGYWAFLMGHIVMSSIA